jgi:hypothetical protein
VFLDPTVKWRPFPSMLDGIKAPPFVLDRGLWRGVLSLIVLESYPDSTRAYAVEVRCDIYCASEEAIHSIAGNGAENSHYDGSIYVKEAKNSKAVEMLKTMDYLRRGARARHFLFVGSDFSYETVGFEEPIMQAFASRDEAYSWVPPGRR